MQCIQCWLRVESQVEREWGIPSRLVYSDCQAVLEPFGLWVPEVIEGLQVIERVFREHWGNLAKNSAPKPNTSRRSR